jgi:hypothetical protein
MLTGVGAATSAFSPTAITQSVTMAGLAEKNPALPRPRAPQFVAVQPPANDERPSTDVALIAIQFDQMSTSALLLV